MACPDLLILRHGETEWNRARRMQGVLDSPLTDKGRAQAVAMGALLARLGIDAQSHDILCSPQGRARQTAALALGPLGLTARTEPRLAEMSVGDWSGLTLDEIAAGWPAPDPHEPFLDFYARAPGGDGLDAMWDRMAGFWAELTRPAVLITHGITSRILRTVAMGYGPDRLADLPGGQGVIHRVRQGSHETLTP